MKKLDFVVLAMAIIPVTSIAQYMRAEGEFVSKSATLKTLLLDPSKGIVAASATVAVGACSGTIAGLGKMEGKTLLVEPYVKAEGGEQCILKVSFDPQWGRAKITEGGNCSPYHGASCSWEGQELKRKAQ